MYVDVILSDGEACHVRQLGLFELDAIPVPATDRFTYKMKVLSGEEYDVELELERYNVAPQKPEIPESEIVDRSAAWYELREWQLYQAALFHEKRRAQELIQYQNDVLDYILCNCVDKKDISRIENATDWDTIYDVAIVPQLTYEIIAETLRTTFRASYNDDEIFVAFEKTSGGNGRYDSIKLWENELMLEMRMTELEYISMSIDERARKVCALHLPKWLEALEADASAKKLAAKTKK